MVLKMEFINQTNIKKLKKVYVKHVTFFCEKNATNQTV